MKTGHVGLNVPDVTRALPFYTGVFGWDVLSESADPEKRFAFLGDRDGIVVTLWEQSDGGFAADRPGLHHLAFEVASIDDVEAAEDARPCAGRDGAARRDRPARRGRRLGRHLLHRPRRHPARDLRRRGRARARRGPSGRGADVRVLLGRCAAITRASAPSSSARAVPRRAERLGARHPRRAAGRRAGVPRRAAAALRRARRPRRPRLVLGAERPAGLRRDARRPDGRRRRAAAAAHDPLARAARRPARRPSGCSAIEPQTRRRIRVNGTAELGPDGAAGHARSRSTRNCPKYIARRDVAGEARRPPPRPRRRRARRAERRRPAPGRRRRHVLHRHRRRPTAPPTRRTAAARPGFVAVHDERRLSFPDYAGNSMYMTLGNLAANPRAGLLFVDWETGDTLADQRSRDGRLVAGAGRRDPRCTARRRRRGRARASPSAARSRCAGCSRSARASTRRRRYARARARPRRPHLLPPARRRHRPSSAPTATRSARSRTCSPTRTRTSSTGS